MKWGLSMNEIVRSRTVTATAILGLNAALAVWPVDDPIYVTTQSIPTHSFFERSLAGSRAVTLHDCAHEIASIFAFLSEGQEPLGAEFEAVWDRNVDSLYQA